MTTCIALLGPTLDNGFGDRRWQRWRPTVAMCMQEDLLITELHLLYQQKFASLAKVVMVDIRSVSPETVITPHVIAFANPWDFAEVYGCLHDWCRGFTFQPDESYLVHITTGTHVQQICWFLLAESRHLPAKLLQTSPASGKAGEKDPAGTYTTIDLDLSRYDALAERFAAEKQEGAALLRAGIQTRNEAYNSIIDDIEMVAGASTAPILLNGATGTGKTHLARRIYELKAGRHQVSGPFVEVNCATLRGDQAMSMLFGHTKGAFTGAAQARAGLLQKADGGVLFLDEIGELGLDEQAMLLRALEEGAWLPVGSDQVAAADFQLLAGTNRDLHDAVRSGSFREDLLARINLWQYELPSLHERREDIEPNLTFELERFADEHGRQVRFNAEARAAFLAFATRPDAAWRGNFRDFGGALTRLCTRAQHGRITAPLVEQECRRLEQDWRRLGGDGHGPQGDLVERFLGAAAADLDLFDRLQLEPVLSLCLRSRSCADAGRALYAESRKKKASSNDADRLAKYLRKFGLKWADLHP
jgi:transcriptional regulatory protein RtcR